MLVLLSAWIRDLIMEEGAIANPAREFNRFGGRSMGLVRAAREKMLPVRTYSARIARISKNNRVVRKPRFPDNVPEKKRECAAMCGKLKRDSGENREVLEQV
jgi:hypothetical protein